MGEISLEKALAQLSSDKLKERTEGLTGLFQYLMLDYFVGGLILTRSFREIRSQGNPAAKQRELKTVSFLTSLPIPCCSITNVN